MNPITPAEMREIDLELWVWGPDKKRSVALRLFDEVKRLQYVNGVLEKEKSRLEDQLNDIEEEQDGPSNQNRTEILELEDLIKAQREHVRLLEAQKADWASKYGEIETQKSLLEVEVERLKQNPLSEDEKDNRISELEEQVKLLKLRATVSKRTKK